MRSSSTQRRRVWVSPLLPLLPAGYSFSRWFSAKRKVLWERLTNAGVLFSLLRRAMIKIATKRFGFSPVMKVISSVTAEGKKVCACVNHGTLKAKFKFKASRCPAVEFAQQKMAAGSPAWIWHLHRQRRSLPGTRLRSGVVVTTGSSALFQKVLQTVVTCRVRVAVTNLICK